VVPSRDLAKKVALTKWSEGGVDPCFACGLCTAVCPVHNNVDLSFDPRKLVRMTIMGQKEELLRSELLWLCLLCNSCGYHCPRGVKFSHVVPILREMALQQEYAKASLLKKVGYRYILPSRKRLACASKFIAFYQRNRRLFENLGISRLFPDSVELLAKVLPPVASPPLRERLAERVPAEGKTKYRVAFFLGCADDLIYTDVAKATISLLTSLGCEVLIPKQIQCCGMPFVGYSDMRLAKHMALQNISALEKTGADFIVADCATCSSFLKEYKLLFSDDPSYAHRAAFFASKVRDVTEMLSILSFENGLLGRLRARLVFHDPCHLRKTQRIWREPRELLRKVEGLEVLEAMEPLLCCGGAGTYNVFQYEASMKILEKKLQRLMETKPDLIVTSCPGCITQLKMGIHMKGLPYGVKHVVEVIKESFLEKT